MDILNIIIEDIVQLNLIFQEKLLDLNRFVQFEDISLVLKLPNSFFLFLYKQFVDFQLVFVDFLLLFLEFFLFFDLDLFAFFSDFLEVVLEDFLLFSFEFLLDLDLFQLDL